MKKIKNLLASTLCLGIFLVGCGQASQEENVERYIQSALDVNYKAITSDYMQITGATEDEAKQTHAQCVEVETDSFFEYFTIGYKTKEQFDKVTQLYEAVYSHADYEILGVEQVEENHFKANIAVRPIDIIHLIVNDIDDLHKILEEKYMQTETMTDEEFQTHSEEYDKEWADGLINIFESKLSELGYLEKQEISIDVYIDESNIYTFDEEKFWQIDDYIISYEIA